ncbi:hypothetical protein GCM10010272_59460 [Streptomyces lateritius]|nr:hypothetical protein GCM10010272_59460 [Streptomyces lateritius]
MAPQGPCPYGRGPEAFPAPFEGPSPRAFWERKPPPQTPAAFEAASIAASDLRTWLRSVVYQKSGSDDFK